MIVGGKRVKLRRLGFKIETLNAAVLAHPLYELLERPPQ